ncbi:aminotransferase class III-fold pyridoxal phosphate-dependent enzyme [Aliiglaciecola sp.]|nr:aminotransferase class III-fold pyridoxal phosphate-dependent enzyme [Aliiglaciecola sp.]
MLTTHQIASYMEPGKHGSTFGGNPLACAIANKVLEIVTNPNFLENVRHSEGLIRSLFAQSSVMRLVFSEIRGAGLLLGLVLKDDYQGTAKVICDIAAHHGLMCNYAGDNVVRLAPALNITEVEIRTGFERLEQALKAFLTS